MSDMASHHPSNYDPALHDNQIIAVYESVERAHSVRQMLIDAGVPAGEIQVTDGSTTTGAGTTRAGTAEQDEGFWGSIKNLFAPDDDYHAYHSALGRGHAMVMVTPRGTADRQAIINVLEQSDPVDLDAKMTEWGSTSGTMNTAAAPLGAASMATAASRDTTAMRTTAAAMPGAAVPMGTTDETIKVAQERLRVGKREVAQGAVRVRSYVVERPVEEQVTLHEERVSIDRRPVDRALTGNEANLFQERTIEARSTSEEAVVSKEARIVEEIGLHKEAADRTETVRDTVRETKVEVEDPAKGHTIDKTSRP